MLRACNKQPKFYASFKQVYCVVTLFLECIQLHTLRWANRRKELNEFVTYIICILYYFVKSQVIKFYLVADPFDFTISCRELYTNFTCFFAVLTESDIRRLEWYVLVQNYLVDYRLIIHNLMLKYGLIIDSFIWLRNSFFQLEPIIHHLMLKYGPIITRKIGYWVTKRWWVCVGSLVWNFEWKPAHHNCDVDLSEMQGITVGVKNPLLVRVSPGPNPSSFIEH